MPAPPPARGPEEALLLAVVRAFFWGRPQDAGAPDGVDAERLRLLSVHHGVLPVVTRILRTVPALAPLAPPFSVETLQYARNSLRLAGELRTLLAHLGGAGIPVLPFKGPVLALEAYGDVALRQYADLDLLVPVDDVERALAALAEAGYRPLHPPDPESWPRLRRLGHHLALSRDGVYVEVHWRFSKRLFGFAEDVPGVFARARPGAMHGVAARVPATEDHLLALAMHASRGVWHVLEWTLGIALLARSLPADAWPALLERAARWRCRRVLLVSLVLAHEVLGLELPEPVRRRAASDPALRALAGRMRAGVFARWSKAEYYRAQLALREGVGARVRFASGVLSWAGPEVAAASPGRASPPGLRRLLRFFRPLGEWPRHGVAPDA